ncbi:enoyl-CoA hydratase-related protein [Variovorax guangxiensis]|uniref:enoyl-CoA hydratase-related protein n=1 Tax=Variovorax guangxiensis TaxID=1775474 RepID=UPI00285AC4A7|nr:enoyl-CoA hydratase-related protein [Variovorax guangxiensis]MDR6855929.1 2-(1,2-epoxy-1,2-dihydrophenyl)acetyl-CoA isomerase [Variovorax guangxiensis]
MSEAITWALAESGVLTLTIDRPEVKNAIDTAGQSLLVRLLADAARHPRVKVVVLTGAGAAFCTGADVRSMGAPDPQDAIAQEFGQTELWQAHEARVDRLRRLAEASFLLHDMGKPTLAKLRGPAAGLGFSLALACDFRVAADNAFFVSSFAKIGTPGDYGGSYFLTQLVGPSKAKEIYMLSDRVGAAEALALGMVNRVVADAELDAAADAFALRLANGPALALRAIKENVHAAAHQTLQQVLDLEARNMIRCRLSEDCKEALAAFQQKREPRFEGR